MPERKWFRNRPIRRTKARNGLIKIIFDDGLPGQPGDTVHVPEKEYVSGVKREFVKSETPSVRTG